MDFLVSCFSLKFFLLQQKSVSPFGFLLLCSIVKDVPVSITKTKMIMRGRFM